MDSRQRSCVMSCENSCEVAWLGYCRNINRDIVKWIEHKFGKRDTDDRGN